MYALSFTKYHIPIILCNFFYQSPLAYSTLRHNNHMQYMYSNYNYQYIVSPSRPLLAMYTRTVNRCWWYWLWSLAGTTFSAFIIGHSVGMTESWRQFSYLTVQVSHKINGDKWSLCTSCYSTSIIIDLCMRW